MSTVPSARPSQDRNQPPAERLPLRWVVIALLAVTAGGVGYLAAGIVTAIVTACTVATALYKDHRVTPARCPYGRQHRNS